MKNKKSPLISVIMPVYNAGDFLVEAIESIRNQTYKNWELLAVDDASTDNSLNILKKYSKKDKRIKIFKNSENKGVAWSATIALKKSKGDFIARADADDVSFPKRFEKQIKFLNENKDVVVVGGTLQVMNKEGVLTGVITYPKNSKKIREMIFSSMPVAQPSFMVNAKMLPPTFKWYDLKARVAEEVELMFKLFEYGEASNLPETLIKYRVHGTNTSLVDPKKTFYSTLRTRISAIRKYGYRPTPKGLVITAAQFFVVSILPSRAIYPLFSVVRGAKKIAIKFGSNISGAYRFATSS